MAFGKYVLAPEKVPKQIGEWDVTEVLVPTSPIVGWLSLSEAYTCISQSLQTVGDSSIQLFFPDGNENNRNRAMELLKGGNLLLLTPTMPFFEG